MPSVVEKILFSSSGGKDSALALYEIKKRQDIEIVSLITTIREDYDRISMHGLRQVLLENQTKSLECIFDRMKESLIRGEWIEIRGFGSFAVQGPPARPGPARPLNTRGHPRLLPHHA